MSRIVTIDKKQRKQPKIDYKGQERSWNFLFKAMLNYISYRNGNHYLLNVSSLPNTLNNRISFQIAMGEECLFTVKQIVWAKVPDYPWWPARIVKGLAQRSRNIYRVHFFGDPTYCYLQSQRLLDFESGLALLPEEHSIDLILKKPIQLAKAAFKKSKSQQCTVDTQQQCFNEIQPSTADSFQQTKLQSKPVIENLEKPQHIQQMQPQNKIQNTFVLPQMSHINTQNVIDIISSQAFRQLKKSKGYNNRKQALEIELKLKHMLLAKYNLHEIGKSHDQQQPKQIMFRIHRRKLLSKQKKNKMNKNRDYLHLIAKKLFKIVKHQFSTTTVQTQESISRIMQNFKNNTNDKKYIAKSYCKIAKYMRIRKLKGAELQQIVHGIEQQIFCKKYTGFDDHYSIYEDLKKEDQQKSKVTQIQAQNH